MSETKLEIRFDKLNRAELGRHRGSRWNKYKAGITTPGRELLIKVDLHVPGTLQVFDHPVWALAAGTPLAIQQLRDLVFQLPKGFVDLFCKEETTDKSDFWINEQFDHRTVIAGIRNAYTLGKIDRLNAIAALLALVHDGRLRQREAQHFDAHLAVVEVARATPEDKFSKFFAWRLESLVLQEWLKTEYTDVHRRQQFDELRAVEFGSLEPWAPRQASLKLGSGPNKKEAADRQSTRGYWVAQKLLLQPEKRLPWPS